MGAGGKNLKYTRYFMSLHIGICAYTPGLELLGLWCGEKRILRDVLGRATVRNITKENFFGGDKKEGGLSGLMFWLPGDPQQRIPGALAKKMGRTRENCPGFRGLASFFITGRSREGMPTPLPGEMAPSGGDNATGFYLGANNPYLRPWWAQVRRIPLGLNPSISAIRGKDDSAGQPTYHANPAAIVVECMTTWGGAIGPAGIDYPSFERAAQTLYDEGFGLSMLWNRQAKVADFIQEVLDHVQAMVYDDPRTGKTKMKLLRGDYDVADLQEINPSNAKLTNFRRKSWGESANAITVTYTNPETEEDASVTAHDIAAIAAQGGEIHASRNYYGVTDPGLGMQLARRDLSAASRPLATCDVRLTGEFRFLAPGDVKKLRWPELGIVSAVMRVMKVRGSKDGYIIASLLEDVFSAGLGEYEPVATSGIPSPDVDASPITDVVAITRPYFLASVGENSDLTANLVYPEGVTAILAAPNSAADVAYDAYFPIPLVTGGTAVALYDTFEFVFKAPLLTALVAEATTLIPAFGDHIVSAPAVGDFLLIGTGGDSTTEIVLVTVADETGFQVSRGMLDTVPRDWPAGTFVRTIPNNDTAFDDTLRVAGEIVPYQFASRTDTDELAVADAPIKNVTVNDRAHRPIRPANVKINGQGFGIFNAAGLTSYNITWSNRSRLNEVVQAWQWTAASTGLEAGQTTIVEVRSAAGVLLASYNAAGGSSQVIPKSAFGSETSGSIRVRSSRDSLSSLQYFEMPLIFI